MSNLIGTASTTQQLQLEALNEVIKLLIEKEAKLDARISERGSITPVSLRSFRLRFQTAFPGNVSLFNLDGGILPAGNFSAWVSHPANRSAEGESLAPVTAAAMTGSYGGWSSAAASRPRHSVMRVHARSVSPGW